MEHVKRFQDSFQYDNALTLAEIIYAENKSEENLVILAEVHLRRREFKMAHELLKGAVHQKCRYLLALACLHLGNFHEAEEALLNADGVIANGACGLHLLGVVCQRSQRPEVAATYYRQALQMDPLSFESFTALCSLGLVEDADKLLGRSVSYVPLASSDRVSDQHDSDGRPAEASTTRRQQHEEGVQESASQLLESSVAPPCAGQTHFDSAQLATATRANLSSEWRPPRPQPNQFGTPSLTTDHSVHSGGGVTGVLNFDAASSGGGHSVAPSSASMMDGLPLPTPTSSAAQDAGDVSTAPPKILNFDTPQSESHSTPVVTGFAQQPSAFRNSAQHAPSPTRRPPNAFAESSEVPGTVSSQEGKSVRTPLPTFTTGGRLLFHSSSSSSSSTGEKPPKLYKVSEHTKNPSDASQSAASSSSSSSSSSAPSSAKMEAQPSKKTGREGDQNPANRRSDEHQRGHPHAPTPQVSGERLGFASGRGNGDDSIVLPTLLSVLGSLGRAHWHASLHRGPDAIECLYGLPHHHFATAHAQHLLGRAHFEMANYEKARQALNLMQRLSPYRMPGLELLSTTLWQLNRKVELSYLAQRVVAFPEGRGSPQAWCAVGNCFSLQREHEAALKVFQRAIQVDPEFTYAYTLCGYEYVANEDFEKATALFRKAIQTSSRHYNAWYGLGSIYLRQEKYDLAEYHYRRALSINPQNPVLYCQLGNVLHKTRKCEDAFEMLRIAQEKAPSNPQVRFTRAEVLETMASSLSDNPEAQRRCFEQALEELEAVHREVPKEAQVAFKLGAVCKKLGRKDAALRYFTLAYDLDPKDNNQNKNALERLEQPDLEEDSF